MPFVVRKKPGALGENFCDVVRRIHIMLDSSITKATPALVKAMERDEQAKVMGFQCRPGLSESGRKDLEKQAWVPAAWKADCECQMTGQKANPLELLNRHWGYRFDATELPYMGVGRFFLVSKGEFVIFGWPMAEMMAAGADIGDTSTFFTNQGNDKSVEFMDANGYFVTAQPGDVVYVPYFHHVGSLCTPRADTCGRLAVLPLLSKGAFKYGQQKIKERVVQLQDLL